MDKKNTGMIGFILALVGVIMIFINTFIGLVISVMAFIMGLVNMSQKGILIKLTIAFSMIAICIQVFMLVVAYKTVDNVREDANNDVNSTINLNKENRFQIDAELYFFKVINNQSSNTGELVATMGEIGTTINGCNGYAVYNYDTKNTKAYIDCGNYKTQGFDESKLK